MIGDSLGDCARGLFEGLCLGTAGGLGSREACFEGLVQQGQARKCWRSKRTVVRAIGPVCGVTAYVEDGAFDGYVGGIGRAVTLARYQLVNP